MGQSMESNTPKTGGIKRWFVILGSIILLIVLLQMSSRLIEIVDAEEYAVVQYPNGTLEVWHEPGLHLQWLGKVTAYKKSNQFWFSRHKDQGKTGDESIDTRFNDAGTAKVSGGIRYDLPVPKGHEKKDLEAFQQQIINIHTRYGSTARIESELIRPIMQRSVFLSGQLKSSKEVFSTAAGRFQQDIEDQATNGIYRTITENVRVKDELTGETKMMTLEKVVADKEGPNGIARIDVSPVAYFGMRLYSLSIDSIEPDGAVKGQIAEQQKITMEVQTSMARAKQAEQQALTAVKEGEAKAAATKWEQEAIKAREVTKAQQEKQVAETNAEKDKKVAETKAEQMKQVAMLGAEAAKFYKQEQDLRAEADANYKTKILYADGALAQKLDAYVKVSQMYADAMRDYKGAWVPQLVMGGGQSGSNSSVQDLMSLLSAKAAKDLSLDLSITGPQGKKNN
jgi:regulator of protease activity HflC (stomatin/prohibitin superfamily)